MAPVCLASSQRREWRKDNKEVGLLLLPKGTSPLLSMNVLLYLIRGTHLPSSLSGYSTHLGVSFSQITCTSVNKLWSAASGVILAFLRGNTTTCKRSTC